MISDILDGKCDDTLTSLNDAIRMRREVLRTKALGNLKAGDRVRLAENISPKYLANVEATVKSKVRTSLVVDLDHQLGRYHKSIRVNAGLCEKLQTT